eukprot:s1142_g4.t1
MVRRYERLRHLGVGRFGVSLLIKDVESDTLAMMKTIDVAALNGAERSELLRELRGLTKLRHPYLLPMRESFLHQGRLCLIMDYLPRGSLAAEVDAARSFRTQIAPEKVLHSFVQALLGLSYLHSCGTLHRDLRTKRLLRTQSGLVVLTGTALSVVVRRALFFERPNLDALRYLSPELLMEPEAHTAASDMWAMGIILYELMALRTPWEDEHAVRLLEKIRNQSLRPPPKQYSEELTPMCYAMLKREPPSRATAEELLQRPLVQARIVSLLDVELDDAAAGGAVPAQALCWNSAEDSGPRSKALGWPRRKERPRIEAAYLGEAETAAKTQWRSPPTPSPYISICLAFGLFVHSLSAASLRSSRSSMGQCCPGVGPGRIYEALRQATLARAASPMDLSVLRLNFDPSRRFRRVYRLGALLGEGSFGSVCSCTRRLTGEERAVKQLLKSRMKDGGEDVLNELEILATLDHPNVVKFYEFFEDDLAVLAVTELCGEGDFSSLLPRGPGEEDVRLLYRDVMLGLAYCHSFGIVHRDLKLANCVIARGGPHDRAVAKIIDFGLAVLRREEDCDEEWLYETCGTAAFQAPEVLQRSYGEKCDIWSFGIMVLMQVKGSDNDPVQTASRSERYEKLELYLDAMSQELGGNKAFRLAERLLCRDVAQRPSAQAALESSWLRPPSVRAQEAAPNLMSRKDRSYLRRSLSAFAKLSPFDKVVLLMASNASRCHRSDFCRKTSKLFMSTDTDKSGFLNQEEVQRLHAPYVLQASLHT